MSVGSQRLGCDKCKKKQKLGLVVDCKKCPLVINKLLPENKEAWEYYCRISGQVNEQGSLQFGAIEFIFNIYLPHYSVSEKRSIFEKILLIHQIAMEKRE